MRRGVSGKLSTLPNMNHEDPGGQPDQTSESTKDRDHVRIAAGTLELLTLGPSKYL